MRSFCSPNKWAYVERKAIKIYLSSELMGEKFNLKMREHFPIERAGAGTACLMSYSGRSKLNLDNFR